MAAINNTEVVLFVISAIKDVFNEYVKTGKYDEAKIKNAILQVQLVMDNEKTEGRPYEHLQEYINALKEIDYTGFNAEFNK